MLQFICYHPITGSQNWKQSSLSEVRVRDFISEKGKEKEEGKMGRRGTSMKKNEKEKQMIDPTASKDQLECVPCFSNFSPELAKDLSELASLGTKILEKTKSPRRSFRIKNVTSSSQVRDIETVIGNIDISDDEERLEEEQGEQEKESFDEQKTEPQVILCARNMEEKIDHLILIIEKQRKTIESLLSKGATNSCPPENPCTNDTRSDLKSNRYKEMYITSQKKIQELQDEKFELQKKLEAALAKFEGYEKGQDVYSKAIDKLKDVFLVSSLTKATEMALGMSSSKPVASNARAAKRKKTEN